MIIIMKIKNLKYYAAMITTATAISLSSCNNYNINSKNEIEKETNTKNEIEVTICRQLENNEYHIKIESSVYIPEDNNISNSPNEINSSTLETLLIDIEKKYNGKITKLNIWSDIELNFLNNKQIQKNIKSLYKANNSIILKY